jgi:hypothetical protein
LCSPVLPTNTTNSMRRLVLKLDRAPDVVVQVGEVPDTPSRVVHGAAVKVPSLELVVDGAVTEESLCARLIDVE